MPEEEKVVTGPNTADMMDKAARWRGGLPAGVIGVLGASVLLWRLAVGTGLSGDVFWQWTAGQWMLLHHRLLTYDPFSYTVRHRSWVTEEWGYEVLLAALVRTVGPVAFWLLSAGVGTLTVWTVAVRVARQAGWNWAGAVALLLGAGLLLFQRDRPQEISYWFFALELLVLWLARVRPRWAVLLPFLLFVWANLHGSFLLGLLVLVFNALWAFLPWQWGRLKAEAVLSRRNAVLTLAGSAVATLINPYGPGLISYAYHVSSNPAIANVIEEWQSPDFHYITLLLLVALPLAVTVTALAVQDHEVPAGDLVLTGGLLVATLDSVRFMPYFLVAWCVLTARLRPFGLGAGRPLLATWIGVAAVAVVLLTGHKYAPGLAASDQPIAAMPYLRTHPGRVFATYRWGDYLIHEGVPVFIDGRTDLYTGTGVLAEYLAVNNLTENPDRVLGRYHVRYVLWPPHTALAVYLAHDPHWRLVYTTPTAEVFQHQGSWRLARG
jgi:hypothetical protein